MSKEIFESKVTKDAAKRFRMLCEYTFNLTEDDGEEAPEMQPEGEDNAMPPQETPQEQDMNMSGNEGGAPGFNPQENIGNEEQIPTDDMGSEMPVDMDNNGITEPIQPEDEVINVDDLTNAQEETEEKVEDVHITMEKGFEKILDIINQLDKKINISTSNMEDIKREIEKRNPTPLEKLNMRATNDSYPFNVKPNEYWEEKEKTSHYRVGDDNNEKEEYVITQKDIDNVTDFAQISKELNTSEFNQNLMNIFGLR